MWGLRSPTPRGRTESCTLRILSDALTVLTGVVMPQWIMGYALWITWLMPLWISQPYGLGRIYPGCALWITHAGACYGLGD